MDRLLPTAAVERIHVLIIGTFNPAPPLLHLLTQQEKQQFAAIEKTKSYIRLSQVKNFYDRPQNRFWKIMDAIHHTNFYMAKALKTKNPNGLKFYSGMDRNQVFARQNQFCMAKNVFITDLVRVIEPSSFANIYYGFPDKAIEQSPCEWNTNGIKNVIHTYQPTKVLINLKLNMKTLPRISAQLEQIKSGFPGRVFHVNSTSGNAGYTYSELLTNWKSHF
jgi:hypothetical protein